MRILQRKDIHHQDTKCDNPPPTAKPQSYSGERNKKTQGIGKHFQKMEEK